MNATATSAVEPEPSTENTHIGTDDDVFANGIIHLLSKTHDVSLAEEHITSIKHLAADLEEAVKAVWPRRQGIRYTQVHVLLIRWEDDDLGVLSEIQELKHVFKDIYNYNVETYDIPNTRPQRTLNQRIQEFLQYDEENGNETLLIVYYGGHARRVHDSNEPPIWFANRKPTSPAAPCAGIQSLLEESEADVLLLYDCCHSAPTRTNRCLQSRKSVTEAISACGYEAIAPEVDEHSFSRALIQTLAAASQGHLFSVGELHSWILGRLKCWLPSLAQNDDGNFLRHADGRLAYERQPRKTPIYSILCETEPRRSIVLAPLRTSASDASSLDSGYHDINPASLTSAKDEESQLGSRNPFRKLGSSNEENEEHPQILLSIRLEKTELDIQVWRDWLRNLPAEGQDIKIEGIYRSFSTLMLIRMPVAIWDLLPENPAYSFVGFVTSENMFLKISQGSVYQEEYPKKSAIDSGKTILKDSEGSKLQHASTSISGVAWKSKFPKYSRVPKIPLPEETPTGMPRLLIDPDTSSHQRTRSASGSSGGTSRIWNIETSKVHGTIPTIEHKTMLPREQKKDITEPEEPDQHFSDPSSSIGKSSPLRAHRSDVIVQISFLEGQFSLIHIPLQLYRELLQPLLVLILPQEHLHRFNSALEGSSMDNGHSFLNISVTPTECSVVCHTAWAQYLFAPIIARLPETYSMKAKISKEKYFIFAVSGAGMEEGQRVIDVVAPLAIAEISILFIPTCHTDFIIAPIKDLSKVREVLIIHGFDYSPPGTFFNPGAFQTPSPSIVADLQRSSFSALKECNIVPFTEPGLQLVQCTGKKMIYKDDYLQALTAIDTIDSKLYIGLVSALTQKPRFLSVTISCDDAPSLLMDKSLLRLFGDSLIGDTATELVPIFLNLVERQLDSSAILCGVSEKLIDEMRRRQGRALNPDWELKYFSTAQDGVLIVSAEGSEMTLDTLRALCEYGDSSRNPSTPLSKGKKSHLGTTRKGKTPRRTIHF